MKNQTICVFFVLLFAAPGQAEVIFSTFGPGDTFGGPFWPIEWSPDLDTANQFSFAGPTRYSLDTIELAVSLVFGTNELDVWLMSDDGGKPGDIIEDFSFTNDMTHIPGTILLGNSIQYPVLDPGTYWLAASAPSSNTVASWNLSLDEMGISPRMGTIALGSGVGQWEDPSSGVPMGAFRIDGTPIGAVNPVVPAPGALLLASMGVALVSWLRRSRTL